MSDPRFSEADKDFEKEGLDGDSRKILDRAERTARAEFEVDKEAQFIMTGDGLRAGYKIEIHFGPGRTERQDFNALVLLMSSGLHFHGGGDGQMYVCLDHGIFETKKSPSALPILRELYRKPGPDRSHGCGAPVPEGMVALGKAYCTECGRFLDAANNLTGQIPFYGSTQELAELVEMLFHKLKMNADIYCKYSKTDIRYAACEAKKGYDEARRLRGLFIYPLKNILKDTEGGASTQARFKAFFSA